MILSVDFGTSSVKLSLLDETGRTIESQKEEYLYILEPGEKVEEDPAAVLEAFYHAANRLTPALRQEVTLLCYDTYSPSLLLMEESGKPLTRIITHLDRRSRKQSEYIDQVMGRERYQAIAGAFPFTGGITLTTILWYMQEQPKLVEKVERVGHLNTYVYHVFTGVWAMDMVNASMLGVYDTLHQSGWSKEILSAFHISESWFPAIYMPGEILGQLLPGIAQKLGVPAGIPVALGTNDVVAAHAGAGNTRSGQVLNTAGSSDMVSILTDTPAIHPGYYVRNAGRPGLWQIYATPCGGFAIDWFRKEFCRDLSDEEFFGKFLPQSLQCAVDCPVTFDPYLAEDRQSMERKKASWKGLSLSSTRKQLLGALLFSMQDVLSSVVQEVAKHIEMEHTIRVTGGMVSDAILQLKEQAFPGYEFVVVDDCPTIGNYRLAQPFLEKQ